MTPVGVTDFWKNISEVGRKISKRCNFHDLIDKIDLTSSTDDLFNDYFQEDGVCIKSDVVLEWLKIEIEEIKFVASENLEIRNSVFFGDVKIVLEKGCCSPIIHSSIFLGKLTVELAGSNARDLEISNCLIGTIAIKRSSIREIKISESVAKNLVLDNTGCQKFSAYANIFDGMSISKFSCSEVKFPSGQIRHLKKGLSNNSEAIFSATAPPPKKYIEHILIESGGNNSEYHSIAETFDFLLQNTSATSDAKTRAHLRYLQIISRMNSCSAKAVVWAFGGLLKPYRVAIVSAVAILVFSLAYYLFFLDSLFIGEFTLKEYWECLYFSGIAFTTIGFGDIIPKGAARGIAVVEGVIGVILSSALVASFIRKYAE